MKEFSKIDLKALKEQFEKEKIPTNLTEKGEKYVYKLRSMIVIQDKKISSLKEQLKRMS